MWTDEASGMYSPYLSIAEEGTSPRAHFIKKFLFFYFSLKHQFQPRISVNKIPTLID